MCTETRLASQKDSGYAWVVLLAACLSRILQSSGEAIMGVLLIELKYTFNIPAAQLVAASTTQLGIAEVVSIPVGLCMSRLGARPVTIAGGIISAAGYFGASFVSDISFFFLTFGFISAIGVSCISMGAVVPLYSYFEKRRGLAMGLSMAGYSLGHFIWPPLVTVLFHSYGWRGCFMILAGCQLNECVLGALMIPFKDNKPSEKWENAKTDTSRDKSSVKTDTDMDESAGLGSQWKRFRHKYMLMYCAISFVGFTGYSFTTAYLPTMAEDLGTSDTNAALLVSVFGMASCASRIFHGVLADMIWVKDNRFIVIVFVYALAGIAKICVISMSTYTHLAAFAAVDGFANGGFNALMYVILADLVSSEHMTMGTAIYSAAVGISLLASNPASGWLYSYYGSLVEPAIIIGCIQLFAAILALIFHIYIKVADIRNPNPPIVTVV